MRRIAAVAVALAAMVGMVGCSVGRTAPAKRIPSSFMAGVAAVSEARFASVAGVTPAVVEHYIRLGEPFDVSFAGPSVPTIQIEPRGFTLASISSGKEDQWLRSYATAAARYGHPLILGFAPEMNGHWYGWGYTHSTPAAYISAWRHVVTVFRLARARNVRWLWTVNVTYSGPDRPSTSVSGVREWWPGRSWVSYAGIDGYYYLPSQHFYEVFGPTIVQIRSLSSVPILISEAAAAPKAGKAEKITDLFNGARSAGLAGVILFDLPGNRDWPIDNDPAALAAFRKAAAS